MARRYALVPESWLNAKQDEGEKKPEGVTISHIVKPKKKNESLEQLLPKNLRGKAKILLHYLNEVLKLDENDRVIYADGYVGSSVLDLIRYFVSPWVKHRPLDAPRFKDLMNEAGVPESAIARKQPANDGILSQWKLPP